MHLCCFVKMNLFLNILVVYLIPIVLFTVGRNEYMENVDEHRLNQRTKLNVSDEILSECSSNQIVLEIKSITAKDYYYYISGTVSKDHIVVYFIKTYSSYNATADFIIRQGKTISTTAERTFSASTRDQGVHSLYFVGEDTVTRCRSNVVQIPIFKYISGQKNSLHLWSPHLQIIDNNCFIHCFISEPSDIYFMIEKQSKLQSSQQKTPNEVVSLGYYAGTFANEASIYVGSLSDHDEYRSWIVLKKETTVSDPYSFDFLIPGCYIDVSVDLLSSIASTANLITLTLAIQSNQFPLTMTILSEARDKHGNRPSLDHVIKDGQSFNVESSNPLSVQITSSLSGHQIFWIILSSKEKECYSNLFRFVYNPLISDDAHPIYLSSPLITSVYSSNQQKEASPSPSTLHLQGIVAYPERITEKHRPFCECYYSYSPAIPIPTNERFSVSLKHFNDDYMYSFSVTYKDILQLEDYQVLHIAAEETLSNQNHEIVKVKELMQCSQFFFSLSVRNFDEEINKMTLEGNVTSIAEVYQYYSPSLLKDGISELDLLFKGSLVTVERHQFFILNIDTSTSGYIYFIARKDNCLSMPVCVDIAKKQLCTIS